jgi:transcriptional regulator of acetoin/glycerol metabolism
MAHPWPGNVRELQNVLQYAMIRCQGEVIEPHHFPMLSSKPLPVRHREAKLRKQDVALAMQKADGNKRRAAEILGVSRSTLYRFFDRQKKTP